MVTLRAYANGCLPCVDFRTHPLYWILLMVVAARHSGFSNWRESRFAMRHESQAQFKRFRMEPGFEPNNRHIVEVAANRRPGRLPLYEQLSVCRTGAEMA